MAKSKKTKETGPRMLICQKTGEKFEYSGTGRPPKYSPKAAIEVRKAQRAASQTAKRAENAARRKEYLANEATSGL